MPHNRAVNHDPRHVCILHKCVKHHLPNALVDPTLKTLVSTSPFAALAGQRPPPFLPTAITPSTKGRWSTPTSPCFPGKLGLICSHRSSRKCFVIAIKSHVMMTPHIIHPHKEVLVYLSYKVLDLGHVLWLFVRREIRIFGCCVEALLRETLVQGGRQESNACVLWCRLW